MGVGERGERSFTICNVFLFYPTLLCYRFLIRVKYEPEKKKLAKKKKDFISASSFAEAESVISRLGGRKWKWKWEEQQQWGG